jgi:hypothetical protein
MFINQGHKNAPLNHKNKEKEKGKKEKLSGLSRQTNRTDPATAVCRRS